MVVVVTMRIGSASKNTLQLTPQWKQIVEQQFEFGKKITAKGLIPILEPEVNIKATDNSECEAILRAELHENVSANP